MPISAVLKAKEWGTDLPNLILSSAKAVLLANVIAATSATVNARRLTVLT